MSGVYKLGEMLSPHPLGHRNSICDMVIMAVKFIVVVALFAVSQSTPLAVSGVYRDSRGFATSKAYSGRQGVQSSAQADTHSPGDAAYASAEARDDGHAYMALGNPETLYTYEVPSRINYNIPDSRGIQSAKSSAVVKSHTGTASSQSSVNRGSSLSSSRYQDDGFGVVSSLGNDKGISWHFGKLYDTPQDIGHVHAGLGILQPVVFHENNGFELKNTNAFNKPGLKLIKSSIKSQGIGSAQSSAKIQGSSAAATAEVNESIESDSTKQLNSQDFGYVKSTATAQGSSYGSGFYRNPVDVSFTAKDTADEAYSHGHGSVKSSVNLNSAGYENINANADVNGLGSAKSSTNINAVGYESALGSTTSEVISHGLGSAKSSANLNASGNGNFNPFVDRNFVKSTDNINFSNLNSVNLKANTLGFNSAESSAYLNSAGNANANTNVDGLGSAQSTANVNYPNFGAVNSDAQTHGYGSIKSSANLNSQRRGSVQANAKLNGLGTVKSSANLNSEHRGIAQANANLNGLGSAKSSANLDYEHRGTAQANANLNGLGSAKSSVKLNSEHRGTAQANANLNGLGSAKSSAYLNSEYRRTAQANANLNGLGSAKSSANLNSEHRGTAQANANLNGLGSAKSSAYLNSEYPRTALANANVYGLGSTKSSANLNSERRGTAQADANINGLGSAKSSASVSGFGSANSETNTHNYGFPDDAGYGYADSQANFDGGEYTSAESVINDDPGYLRNIFNDNNWNFGGSATSAAHAHGIGTAHSSARNNGLGSARASAFSS